MAKTDDQFQKVYNRIIPVVIGIPVLFLILFIIVSMVQLHQINTRIEEGQSQVVKEMLARMAPNSSLSESHRMFLTLAVLEEESLSERYRQGHYSLVSRSFKQFLGFFTGIMMVIVGSVFVLLKLREEIDTDVSKGETWKFKLVTNSPGVVFGILGTILISFATGTNDTISVRDSGLYLTREYLVAPYFSEKGPRQDMHEYMKSQTVDEEAFDKEEVIIKHPPSSGESNEKPNTSTKNENINPDEELMIQHPPKK